MSGESPKEGGLGPRGPAQEASQPCVWGEAGEPPCVLTELGGAGSASQQHTFGLFLTY